MKKILFFTIISIFTINGYHIHVFGDSHSRIFSLIRNCSAHWLGPWTMHRVGRDGVNGLNILNFGVREKDIAVFVFGEIDVRVHILKQSLIQNISIKQVILPLVKAYIRAILENKKQFDKLTCIVFCPIPPSDSAFNPSFPIFGTLQERVHVTRMLNHELAQSAIDNGIGVIDVYDYLATEYGGLNPELSDGNVHVGNNNFQLIASALTQCLSEFIQKIRGGGLKGICRMGGCWQKGS